jgi:hypothetical protein
VEVLVCFTVAPHVEWNGETACTPQGRGLGCDGEQFSGKSETALREALATLLYDNWARSANVEFYGFIDCSSIDNLDHGDLTGPGGAGAGVVMVTFVDRDYDQEPTLAVSGLGWHSYFPGDLHVDWQGLRDEIPATQRAILREMGHILGFPYEWARPPTPTPPATPTPCPVDLPKDPAVSWLQRPSVAGSSSLEDYGSVMDRCTPVQNTRPGLSPGDVVGAWQLWGKKIEGSVVGYRGFCPYIDLLPADGGGYTVAPIGSKVITYPCRGGQNATWKHTDTANRFESFLTGPPRCWAVRDNIVSSTTYTDVLNNACDQSEGQLFPVTNVEWRAAGNMCVAAVNGRLQLAICDGSPNQLWTFFDADPATPLLYSQIHSVGTGDCVATQGSFARPGEDLVLNTCSPTDTRQQFIFPGQGVISHPVNNLCVNVKGGSIAADTAIQLTDKCNQIRYPIQFYVSGAFSSLGQCLSSRTTAEGGGIAVVEPCDSAAPQQFWDFHF